LTCPVRINFLIPTPSAFSLGLEYTKEAVPTSIIYSFRKMPILPHVSNVERFNGKPVIVLNQNVSNLVKEVKSLICNSFVCPCNHGSCLSSSIGTFFTPTEPTISLSDLLFACSVKSWILNLYIIRESSKSSKANVYTYNSSIFRKNNWFSIYNESNIPPIISTCNKKSFNFSNYRSMPLDLDTSYVLKIKLFFFNLTTISKPSIFYGIESMAWLETWETWFFTILNSTKKSIKRFINSSNCLLKRTVIAQGYFYFLIFNNWNKIFNLSKTSYPFPCISINKNLIFKGGIIKKPMPIKLGRKSLHLFLGRIKSVSICSEHLFFLLFSVPVRGVTLRTNSNFFLSWNPLIITALADKLLNFNFHYRNDTLKKLFCQVFFVKNDTGVEII